jgi:hypothetical protein
MAISMMNDELEKTGKYSRWLLQLMGPSAWKDMLTPNAAMTYDIFNKQFIFKLSKYEFSNGRPWRSSSDVYFRGFLFSQKRRKKRKIDCRGPKPSQRGSAPKNGLRTPHFPKNAPK